MPNSNDLINQIEKQKFSNINTYLQERIKHVINKMKSYNRVVKQS